MTDLDNAILALLTFRPMPVDELIADLRAWQLNGIHSVPKFLPGDVVDRMERLVLTGKAQLVPGEGFRLPIGEPVKQRNIFG